MTNDSIRVLLVEDDDVDASLVERALSSSTHSFTVKRATRLDDALMSLKDSLPDLIVLDLGLPDGLGIECLDVVHPAAALVPIVVLTGWDEALSKKLMKAGASEFVTKSQIQHGILERLIPLLVRIRELEQEVSLLRGA